MRSSIRIAVLIFLVLLSFVSVINVIALFFGLGTGWFMSNGITIEYIAERLYFSMVAITLVFFTIKYYVDEISPIMREVQ